MLKEAVQHVRGARREDLFGRAHAIYVEQAGVRRDCFDGLPIVATPRILDPVLAHVAGPLGTPTPCTDRTESGGRVASPNRGDPTQVPGGEDQSPEGPEQPYWRRRLQKAYDRPTYPEAKAALKAVLRELEQENPSAAASLEEGMEETLALHRLGVYAILDLSFKTTTCLETTNALVEER